MNMRLPLKFVETVPLTDQFQRSLQELRVSVIDRCNLTILLEPGQEDLADFLAEQRVAIVASLPCYDEKNVARQRGKGVFEKSIIALRRLNDLGYGAAKDGLRLDLVYNPVEAVLPPDQDELEATYREQLARNYGIQFSRLLTVSNMPINRFGSTLVSNGQFEHYMETLTRAYQPANLERIMCRSLISVDWRGYLYDCDFNQMLGLGMRDHRRHPPAPCLRGAPRPGIRGPGGGTPRASDHSSPARRRRGDTRRCALFFDGGFTRRPRCHS